MIIVADTSPINYLVLIGHVQVLESIYSELLIPQSVLHELQDGDAPAAVRKWVSARPRWLQISTLVFRLDPLLVRLDRGEQDAIILAGEIGVRRTVCRR